MRTYSSFITQKGTRFKALFALGLVGFFWGTTWLASKEGVRHMPALQLAGIRLSLGGVCYLAYFLIKGRALPRGREWWPVVMLSFLNFVFSNGLTTWSVKFISAGLAAIIAAIFPLWLVLIGLFSPQERLPARAIAGLFLGFGGICVIFYEHLYDFLNAGFRFGIILSLVATLSWAIGTLYLKKQANNFNPYFSVGLQMLISGLFLYGTSWATGMYIPFGMIPWQSWASIAFLVIVGSVIAYVAYVYALKHLPTGLVSIYAYMNPVVAVLLGWLLFNERLTPFVAVGGCITLAGVYLVNETFRRKA